MSNLRRFLNRLSSLLRAHRAESELAREIDAHLQLQFVEKGRTREEARYAAKRAFGGVEQTRELQRDSHFDSPPKF
jgi:hypothetical protein